jgi:Lar family restriction alleviation protein
MNVNLEPCPFCGGSAKFKEFVPLNDSRSASCHYFIECDRCGARGGAIEYWGGRSDECFRMLCSQWNYRAYLPVKRDNYSIQTL